MKIAFVVYYMTFGGIERQITMLANEMHKRGHQVYVIGLVKNNVCYNLDKDIKYNFVEDSGKGYMAIINRYKGLKGILKQVKPELTVNFMFQSAYFCSFMSKKYTGQILYSERGYPGASFYTIMLRIIRRIAFLRIDKFVFQTKGAQNCFESKIKMRSTVIPNPVFLKREDFNSDIKKNKIFVNIGRLEPQKNQKLLINAFNKVHEKYPDYKLWIYGEGFLRGELEALIDRYSMNSFVYLKGTESDIHNKMLGCFAFVLSSDFEGMPNALIEAMALGIPSISTDCDPGGAKEIIADGEDGLIVEKGSVNELAEKMIYLIEHQDIAQEMGTRASKNIQRYNPQKIYDKWEKFFMMNTKAR